MKDDTIELIILGEPASKANSRKAVRFGSRPAFIKSQKARDYEASALIQLRGQLRGRKPIDVPVAVEITIYYVTQRPDLDESLILDILQKAGAYTNDRLVREKHIFHGIDKVKPRAEIAMWRIGGTK
jgi:Holliday junction resolvase RusA-like endonuclease